MVAYIIIPITATIVSLLWVKVIDKQIEYDNKHPKEKLKDNVDTNNN